MESENDNNNNDNNNKTGNRFIHFGLNLFYVKIKQICPTSILIYL